MTPPLLDQLIRDLPSPESASRFFTQLSERDPRRAGQLEKHAGAWSDVLTLASYSPLLAATMLQEPSYIDSLTRRRGRSKVEEKGEILESLARFALTNSTVEPNVLFSRFRRREIMRIFLRDIRRLNAVVEVAEEISNVADAVLEHALRVARQEADNRYGVPQERTSAGRSVPADVCIVSLGKLGSKELNYSSDIDLMFIYSDDGNTSGAGSRGSVTNREYFCRVAENVTRMLGKQEGEGAAYRVDMRLRPHGRVGPLALREKEMTRYYLTEARDWERQVLIRSRASAGDASIFRRFMAEVQPAVFASDRDPGVALHAVMRSKELIDENRAGDGTFNVKLGRGGIREIEFIAQALQLAYGGSDRWLRVPHTLISIARLADRGHLTEAERSSLSAAYDFLRRLEHILQMEHGLQTHSLPADEEKLRLLAAKMRLSGINEFRDVLKAHTDAVHAAFERVLGHARDAKRTADNADERAMHVVEKIGTDPVLGDGTTGVAAERSQPDNAVMSPRFASLRMVAGDDPDGIAISDDTPATMDLQNVFDGPDADAPMPDILRSMRREWSGALLAIATADSRRSISTGESRRLQTQLAEASVRFALEASRRRVERSFGVSDLPPPNILALGKLGSGTLDYGSDLDVIVTHPDQDRAGEIYARVVEDVVTILSSMTRDGSLYRIDLRLRPYGASGPNVISVAGLEEYIDRHAAIWELLAYIQFRVLPITPDAPDIEARLRNAIARRAATLDPGAVLEETRRIRTALAAKGTGGRDIDIKYGPGGLLDVYFAVRYLQVLNVAAVPADARDTASKLAALESSGLLGPALAQPLRSGHAFLSELDHNIRLIIARSSRFPSGHAAALEQIADRMGLDSAADLAERLAIEMMEIHLAYEQVLGK